MQGSRPDSASASLDLWLSPVYTVRTSEFDQRICTTPRLRVIHFLSVLGTKPAALKTHSQISGTFWVAKGKKGSVQMVGNLENINTFNLKIFETLGSPSRTCLQAKFCLLDLGFWPLFWTIIQATCCHAHDWQISSNQQIAISYLA